MSAPTPDIKRKASAIVRIVRHNCSLKCPPSVATIWIGVPAVPRIPSFVAFPTFLKAERPPTLSSPLAVFAIPANLKTHFAHQLKIIRQTREVRMRSKQNSSDFIGDIRYRRISSQKLSFRLENPACSSTTYMGPKSTMNTMCFPDNIWILKMLFSFLLQSADICNDSYKL